VPATTPDPRVATSTHLDLAKGVLVASTISISPLTDELDDLSINDLVIRYQQDGEEVVAEAILARCDRLVRNRVNRLMRPDCPFDDLYQVARVAVFRAISRWRPDGGASFLTFATRTADGALKRYFRDSMWDVHVARPAKNLALRVSTFTRHFETDHGRSPSVEELADFAGMTVEQVHAGIQAGQGYRVDSIDVPVGDDGPTMAEVLVSDPEGPEWDLMMDLYAGIDQLPDRDKQVVLLSFYGDMTQQEIADRIGCSQMQVSRVLRRSLRAVQRQMQDAAPSN
jgi:RNA polymerase sigma-B factor